MRPAAMAMAGVWLACVVAGASPALAEDAWDEEKLWVEDPVTLPKAPRSEALVEVDIGATASHRAFVDADSLSVGADRVVRYTLVTRMQGGATNVGYEGLRCATRERRLYATGRADGSWHLVRGGRWTPLPKVAGNSPYVALAADIFCPRGLAVESPRRALEALRAGGRPTHY